MTSIALLGTSADPPTCGHQALLEQLLDYHEQVVTWASDNPSKRHALPLEQRCSLLQTLVNAIGDPRLSLVQELSSPWAMTTLQRAKARWPHQTLSFVVGSDLAPQILSWKAADQFVACCQITIVPREGWPIPHGAIRQLRANGGHVELLPLRIPGTASSRARTDADASQIPSVLRPLLREKGFYGFSATPDPAAH
ncbi:MAG: nicotinate-nucleotide adenylyltransferase [Synechococcus sp.]